MATISAHPVFGNRPWLLRTMLAGLVAVGLIGALGWKAWPREAGLKLLDGVPAVTLSDLQPGLVRVGDGPGGSTLEATLAPKPTLGLFPAAAPDAARSVGVTAFLVREENHTSGLPEDQLSLFAVFDDGARVAASESVPVSDDGHQRDAWYVFPTVDAAGRDLMASSARVSLSIGNQDAATAPTLTWSLPIILPKGLDNSARPAGAVSLPTLTRLLTRDLGDVQFGSDTGQEQLTLATEAYATQALGSVAATRLRPDKYIVILTTEALHTANLPTDEAPPTVAVWSAAQAYVDRITLADSPHHRLTAYRFSKPAGFDFGHQILEVQMATGQSAVWHLGLTPAIAAATAPGGMTLGLVLALAGGMVAAMWPCLFQLTAFFIPALAGVTMQQAKEPATAKRRFLVVKAALFFIAGFTLIYTAAGAAIGLAAQRLGNTTGFELWQRWFGVVGGVIIIFLALRTAAKVRAPLICKMPGIGHLGHGQTATKPVEMMLAGIAYATGCMTCFGSALVVAMVVFVGMAQSPLYGAGVLFLFSLGMGIPLVAAATAMAKALPLLTKMEKVVPWMGLVSAVIMIGFGTLLISGNYMLVTQGMYRLASMVR